jgi:hypothetical protein
MQAHPTSTNVFQRFDMDRLTLCSLGLSAISQQYFSLRTNQSSATSQQYFSLRTNQHQPSTTSQTNRLLNHNKQFSIRARFPPCYKEKKRKVIN